MKGQAGFTLIEVLVALAVVAIGLPVVGSLLATSIKGTIKVEQRSKLLAAYRTFETNYLDRTRLAPGVQSGEVESMAWAMEISPLRDGEVGPPGNVTWTPLSIVTTMRSPSGETLRIETIRLGRRGEAR